jgi:hypothetical protein
VTERIDETARLAVLAAAAGPSAVPCPACTPCTLCGGLHKVRPDVAEHWQVRNLPTGAPPPPSADTTRELPKIEEES